MRVLSIDAETNGLYGRAFAVGAVFTDDQRPDGTVDALLVTCPVEGELDPWVAENVPLELRQNPSVDSYAELLDELWKFYDEHRENTDVIAHVAFPVETTLLRDMVTAAPDRQGPFPLLDVASVLKARGFDPTSVDAYNQAHRLWTGQFRSFAPHHPVGDAWAAERAYRHLMAPASGGWMPENARPFAVGEHGPEWPHP